MKGENVILPPITNPSPARNRPGCTVETSIDDTPRNKSELPQIIETNANKNETSPRKSIMKKGEKDFECDNPTAKRISLAQGRRNSSPTGSKYF